VIAAEVVQAAPGLVGERAPGGRLVLVSGRSHRGLAADIADRLGIELGRVELETFTDGEVYCRYAESIRGAEVFIVQSCWPQVNDRLLELLVMVDAARLASAARITAVMPWFPYSRQEKKAAPREPNSARLVADQLEAAGVDRVLTMDLHAGQIQGFFHIPVDHMTALPLFAEHFRAHGLSGEGVVSVSPDLGRVKQARRLSRMLGSGFAVVAKTRPAHEVAVAAEVYGDVRGKAALVGDDIIVTGGTLVAAADALRAAGAVAVHAFATHALFAPGAAGGLAEGLDGLVVTDTVRPPRGKGRLTVLSVADVLAATIANAFAGRSVSSVFAGLNELF
jgi:ribose-phosphate pyrophosphokinase